MIQSYRDLVVWQKAMDLTIEIYKLIKNMPKEETFALSDQIRRAAVSIPSNIAEGQGRVTAKDFIRFLSMARGSLCEHSTQIELCERLNYLERSQTTPIHDQISEIAKMLYALANSVHD